MENKTEKGKCMTCGTQIGFNSIGYCQKCADEYYEQRDREFPYIVHMGNGDREEFATEEEANDFLDKLKNSYVEKK